MTPRADDAPDNYLVRPIGKVSSPIDALSAAPRQADEHAPAARLVLDASVGDALAGVRVGDRVVIVSWLHHADRAVLTTHPRDDRDRPPAGVFATRSPDRPNPVGLHEVTVTAIEGTTLTVDGLDAIDGTPIVDLKPVLGPPDTR